MVEDHDEAGLSRLADVGVVPAQFGRNIVRNFLDDAFRRGVFHADLHPANLLMLPDNVVGYVDFGIVATLSSEARRRLVNLTHAFSTGDPAALYDAFLPVCQLDAHSDLGRLRRQIERFARDWYAEPAIPGRVRLRVSVSRCFMDLLAACRESGVVADRAVVRYIRAVYLADGLVSRIARDFDLARALREVVEGCLMDDARRQLVSRGAAVAVLAARWLRVGPASVVLDSNGARTPRRRRAAAPQEGSPAWPGPRGWTALAVWSVLGLSLVLTGLPGWPDSPALAAVVGVTTTAWTLWVWRLLRPVSFDDRR
jgi:predicted unusual protein kinase regulating ubiquinone biosynthesis (AarF/ABC1/UbiB family)